jgi:hypothetical protein
MNIRVHMRVCVRGVYHVWYGIRKQNSDAIHIHIIIKIENYAYVNIFLQYTARRRGKKLI